MKPVDRSEILPLGEYETIRERFRARVIEEKRTRRVNLGPKITCLFENHDTVLLQVQEMLRTERITREAAIAHEIETYNELLPGEGELSCTAMIEIPEKEERDAFLAAAVGIESGFSIEVGGERCPGRITEDRKLTDQASAVMYLKFSLTPAARAALESGATLRVAHPAYEATTPLTPALARSLADELAS